VRNEILLYVCAVVLVSGTSKPCSASQGLIKVELTRSRLSYLELGLGALHLLLVIADYYL